MKNKRRKLFFLPIKRPLSWANELAHLEMVGSLVHQLTEGVTIEELEKVTNYKAWIDVTKEKEE